MSWSIKHGPLDGDPEREKWKFVREIRERIRFGAFTWNAPSVGSGATVDTTLTTSTDERLEGLRAGMPVSVTPPSTLNAGLHVTAAWVPNDNELTIRLYNSTGGSLDAASGTWSYIGVVV